MSQIQTDYEQVYVTTSRGVRVKCLPVAHVLEKARQQVVEDYPLPPVPTKTVEGVGNTKVEVPYTAETIGGEDVSEKDRIAWENHQNVQAQIQAEQSRRTLRILALRGVEFEMPDGWEKEHEWMGIVVPTDPSEKKYHYFMYEVVGNQADGFAIAKGINVASGMDKELLAQAESNFRNSMEDEKADA